MHTDPVALFRAAAAAVDRADWRAAAALCDPASLAGFKRDLVEQLAPEQPPATLTVEEYLRHDPEMPREVAEYTVARHREHADPTRRLREELPGVPDVAALRALDPVDAFAAWLDGRSPRRQIERLAAEGRISPQAAEQSLAHLPPMYRYVALGAVADGERVAHVLYRHFADGADTWTGEMAEWLARRTPEEQALTRDLAGRTPPMVATCRRQPDGTWRLLAGHEFLNLGNAAIYHVAEEPAAPDAPGEPG